MLKKSLKFLGLGLTLATSCVLAKPQTTAKPITVGIVAPIEIPAMDQITKGFTTELSKLYPGKIHYLIENAQNNINIQRTILQQLKARNVDLVVPIGTSTTYMALAMLNKQPIVSLAAEIKDADRAKLKNKNMTNILDEISIPQQIKFIHAAMPKLKHMTLIYSSDDRIYSEVAQVEDAAKTDNITVQKMMMQQLPDLYAMSKHIDKNSQAIFILKDEPVVSGINTLVQQAEKLHIPVIASDDGSVAKGASFAVGVSETQIGVGGAKLAYKVLTGTPASQVPIAIMAHYDVFVNPAAMKKQSVNLQTIEKTAKQFGYPVKVEG